jgi:DNA-binding XRE family transcriptional regulator
MPNKKNLRDLRREHKLSRRVLALKAGLHLNTIYEIEKNGKVPGINTVRKIANAINVPITEVIEYFF